MRATGLLCLLGAVASLAGGCDWRPTNNEDEALRRAAGRGDLLGIQRLIAHRVSINAADEQGNTPLHEAAKAGHVEAACILVRCGAWIDGPNAKGVTPLVAAISRGRRLVAEFLLEAGATPTLHAAAFLDRPAEATRLLDAGADPNITDPYGRTPLHYATLHGHTNTARTLIEAGADLNARIPRTRREDSLATPLGLAVQQRHTQMVELLLTGGADPNVAAMEDEPPLHLAAEEGQVELAALLLDAGADVNGRDGGGGTALRAAAAHGRLEIAHLLISSGADLDSRPSKSDRWQGTPLMFAVNRGYLDVAGALLKAGADVGVTDEHGETALHLAVTSSYWDTQDEIMEREYPGLDRWDNKALYDRLFRPFRDRLAAQSVELLIEHGADVNPPALRNVTPLHLAAKDGLPLVVKLLLAHGADVGSEVAGEIPSHDSWRPYWECHYQEGQTALHSAAAADEPNTVMVLLDNGSDVSARTASGATPLHFAAEAGDAKAAMLLIDRGADVNAEDEAGESPLAKALVKGHVEVARVLIDAGARKVPVSEYWRRRHRPDIKVVPLIHLALRDPPPEPYWSPSPPPDPNEGVRRRKWLELLLANGVDPNKRDELGNTPLHVAIDKGEVAAAHLLIRYGADVNAGDVDGTTPLHLAAGDGYGTLVAALADCGADVNSRDDDDDTPLHNAARGGHVEAVRLLLARGADTETWNSRDRTPLDEAVRLRHEAVARLLRDAAQEGGGRP